MFWLIVLGVLALPAVVAGAALSVVGSRWVIWISNSSILTQLGLAVTAWLLLATMPDRTNWSGAVGDVCPNIDSLQGHVVGVIALTTLVVGGIAAGSSYVGMAKAGARWPRFALGLGAEAVCFAIWVPLFGAALCGFN